IISQQGALTRRRRFLRPRRFRRFAGMRLWFAAGNDRDIAVMEFEGQRVAGGDALRRIDVPPGGIPHQDIAIGLGVLDRLVMALEPAGEALYVPGLALHAPLQRLLQTRQAVIEALPRLVERRL